MSRLSGDIRIGGEPIAPSIDMRIRYFNGNYYIEGYSFYGTKIGRRTAKKIQKAWHRLWAEHGVDTASKYWADPRKYADEIGECP